MARLAILRRAWLARPRVISGAARAICSFVLAATVAADDSPQPPSDAAARASVLIESLLKERQKIVSATVQVRGSQTLKKGAPPPEQTIRGMYAFDYSLGAFRFDGSRRMHVRVLRPGALGAAGNDLKAAMANAEVQDVDAQLRYVRTRNLCATWCKSTNDSYNQLYLRPPDQGMGGAIARTHWLIDLRACGVMSYFDFQRDEFEKGTGVKDYCEALLKLTVVEVKEKDGQAVIAMRSEFAEHRLTIDTANQFCPVEYVMSWKKGPGNSSDGSTTARVKWTDAGGVRTPKSFTIEFDWPDEGEYALYRFSCLWDNVNQPIDKRFFDYRDFPGIPDRTDVADARRKGSPTIGFWTTEGIVGPEDESEDGPNGADPTEPQRSDAKNTQTLLAGRKAGEERDDNALQMKLVWCPPGEFTMGGFKDDRERPDGEGQVEVVLTHGFWIGKYEVTQAEWAKLKTPALWEHREHVKEGHDFPATYLSWENAMAFCRRLTRQELAAGRLPLGWHYTLPTEAQWEYACRAGSTTPFSFGADAAQLGDFAWFRNNAVAAGELYAHAVGLKKPNPWGLHDMHGNLSEWCRDGWKKELPGGTDPLVAPTDDLRAVREGHFFFPGILCQSAYRDAGRAVDRGNMMGEVGFRVVLCPVEKANK